jgi:DNA recombination protein RmuC
MELTLAILLGLAVVALLVLALSRRPSTTVDDIARGLAPLQTELVRLSRQQDDLRTQLTQGRESWLVELGTAAREIRGDIGEARRTLAEVKAVDEGRARQMDRASDSLRRLEAIIAGSGSRGAAGENILARSLAQLPADLLEVNFAFGSKVVEYALRLPDGRVLPIDSKWPSVAALERLEETDDAVERRRLLEQIAREVRGRIKEMSKYLDPERTFSLALLAVPDAVYMAVPEVHGAGFREGVLLAPYSLALPLLLTLYRLAVRFGTGPDKESIAEHLRELAERLRRIDEELEGRFSRGIVQLENSRDALRTEVGLAQRAAARTLEDSGAGERLDPAREPES